MRFSVREQNEKKMFFHLPAAAQKVTGLHLTTIKTILDRGGNPNYHRKSDNKLFEISEEPPIKILTIEGQRLLFPGRNRERVCFVSNEIYESG